MKLSPGEPNWFRQEPSRAYELGGPSRQVISSGEERMVFTPQGAQFPDGINFLPHIGRTRRGGIQAVSRLTALAIGYEMMRPGG